MNSRDQLSCFYMYKKTNIFFLYIIIYLHYQLLVLTFCRDKLSDSQRPSASCLHELHLGHDDVVLQNGAATHADRVAPRLVHIDL